MPRLLRLRAHVRPFHLSLVVGLITTLFTLNLLSGTDFFVRAELAAYDQQFAERGSIAPPSNLVVVGVDQESFDHLSTDGIRIPRSAMARALTFLHNAGARAVCLDFIYDAPTTPSEDRPLATAMRRAGNVVIASKLPTGSSSNFILAQSSYSPPLDMFARAAAGVGVANVPPDVDGAVRSVDLTLAGPGGTASKPRLYPSLATQCAAVALHKSVAAVTRGLPQQGMLVNYPGPEDPNLPGQGTFHVVQFEPLTATEKAFQDDPKVFRNKIVLIAATYITSKDLLNTPYGQMYGGFTQASALTTILRHDPITPAGDGANDLILLLLGLGTTLIASRFGIWRSTLGTLIIFVGFPLLTTLTFRAFSYWMNLVTPETAVVLTFAGVMAVRFATEERSRRRMHQVFGKMVKPEIVDTLVNSPDGRKVLLPSRRPLSVLFVDIRGFTRMSESIQPETVVSILDVYLQELSESIQNHDGTILKYVGDEIMAIWNAPNDHPDHALRAVLSGLDMVARMDAVNVALHEKGFPAVGYGIGINSGDAVVGLMGSREREQYDVIGDTINTGARLCSAAGRGEIIIGEETFRLAGHLLTTEMTDPLSLKGKSAEFKTYRVLGVRSEPTVAPEVAPVLA